ncbi:MAG: TauD/TfdA family dioxygenase [Pseudomonadota bacterium]
MALAIDPLEDTMGAEVTGLDLKDDLSPETVDALNDAFAEHLVLCVRDQDLTPKQYVAASRHFGKPMVQVNERLNFDDMPELGILSSDDRDELGSGKRVIRGTTWHTDHSFKAVPPKATLLYALVVPERGGDTSFCNMRAAYEALPEETRNRIDGLKAIHSYESSRSPNKMMARSEDEVRDTPDVVHPLVRKHLPTGRKSLFMSTTRLERIDGLSRDESDALVDSLLAHATEKRFQYHHKWRPGDLVIWDNRCTMHHANADYPLDAKRLLHRIILEGETPQ